MPADLEAQIKGAKDEKQVRDAAGVCREFRHLKEILKCCKSWQEIYYVTELLDEPQVSSMFTMHIISWPHFRTRWFGSHAKARILPISKTWDPSITFHSVDSLVTFIRSWTRRDICRQSLPSTSNAQRVSFHIFSTFKALLTFVHFSWRFDQHWMQSLGSQHQSRSYRPKRLRSLWIDDRLSTDNELCLE